MEHDTSLGTERRLRSRMGRSEEAPDPLLRPGRPAPSIRRETPEARRSRVWQSNPLASDADSLAASLPLFLVGAACTGFGLFVRVNNSHAVIDRIPLWLPLIAIGLIALVGGTLSFFATAGGTVEEDPPSSSRWTPPLRSPARPAMAREEPAEPAVAPPRIPPTVRPRPSTGLAPAGSNVARAATTPRPTPRTAVLATGPDSLDDLGVSEGPDPSSDDVSALSELDSIDMDLHPSRLAPAPPRAAASPPSSLDADADSIEAVLADLSEEPSGRTIAPRPPTSRSSPPTPRPLAHCIECSSPIPVSEDPHQCLGCQEPLCAECRGRSLAEGKPGLCVFCSVLDEFHPRATGNPVSSSERS